LIVKPLAICSLIGILQVAIANEQQGLVSATKQEVAESLSSGTSSLNDFGGLIDTFVPGIEISGLAGDGDEPLSFARSFSLGNANTDEPNTKVQLILHRGAELSSDLTEMLTSEQSNQLNSTLNEGDDVEVKLSYNFQTSYFGKSASSHTEIFDSFWNEIDKRRDNSGAENRTRRFSDNLYLALENSIESAQLTKKIKKEAFEKANSMFEQLSHASKHFECRSLEAHVSGYVKDSQKLEAVYSQCLAFIEASKDLNKINTNITSELSPYALGRLLSSQPELQLSGSYRTRDEKVGSDELSIKLSYKFGSNSLNKSGCKDGVSNECLNNLKRFTSKGYNPGEFSLALEYSDIDDQTFLTDDIDFFKKGGEKLTGSLGYGKIVSRDSAQKERARFDISLQFEEFLGNTEGVDRVIATGVYTFRVTDKFSIPITLQYANRSEFIDEDSDQLSANVGFKYDLNFGN